MSKSSGLGKKSPAAHENSPNTPSILLPVSLLQRHSPIWPSNSSESTTQAELKRQMGTELEGHIWECPSQDFISCYLPFPEKPSDTNGVTLSFQEEYNSVFEKLSVDSANFQLKYPILEGRLEWPSLATEPSYYQPLCSILEEVIQVFSDLKGKRPNLHFRTYDRPMADHIEAASPIKPDIVATPYPTQQHETIFWDEPTIVGEVRKDWRDLLKQAATYARAMLSARRNRHVAFLILMNHRKNEVRFAAFHRGGVTLTECLEITRLAGYQELVKIMVAFLLCINNLPEIGEDGSCDAAKVRLPDGRLGVMEKVLFNRAKLRGRATYVSALRVRSANSGIEPGPPEDWDLIFSPNRSNTSSSQGQSISSVKALSRRSTRSKGTTGPTSSQSLNQITTMLEQSSLADNAGPSPLATSVSLDQLPASSSSKTVMGAKKASFYTLPKVSFPLLDDSHDTYKEALEAITEDEKLVMKESWPTIPRSNQEYQAFLDAKGLSGIPEIVARWIIVPPFGKGYYPAKTNIWKKTKTSADHPEERVLQRILFKTCGESLLTAKSPKQLIESVLHAFIGHWHLFRKQWHHSDISLGNILILPEPVWSEVLPGLHENISTRIKSTGVLIDGDNMVPLTGDDISTTFGISGTLPFMSRRLCNETIQPTRMFIFDDIESFGWVILYAALEILGSYSKQWSEWLRWLKSAAPTNIEPLKQSIITRLCTSKDEDLYRRYSLPIPLIQLLQNWFKLCDEMLEADEERLKEAEKEEANQTFWYTRFVGLLLDALKSLPDSWIIPGAGLS